MHHSCTGLSHSVWLTQPRTDKTAPLSKALEALRRNLCHSPALMKGKLSHMAELRISGINWNLSKATWLCTAFRSERFGGPECPAGPQS